MTSAQRGPNDFLLISEFSSPTKAHQIEVADSGAESERLKLWNWSTRGQKYRELTREDLLEIRAAISRLPKESADPPVERLLVVTFREGDQWTTRSYDKESMPEAIKQIFGVINRRDNLYPKMIEKWMREHPPQTMPAEQ